jgi:Ubiquitin family
MQLFVETSWGSRQTFSIRVKADGSNTIKNIKDLIHAYDGTNLLQQWLLSPKQSLCRGIKEETLAKYGIQAGSTIHMAEVVIAHGLRLNSLTKSP